MQRLIDADALKQMIDFRMWDVDDDYPHDEASNRISEDHAVKKIIDEMPTVDAVPVIRCKDCIHNVSNRITDPLCINDYSGDDIVCDYFETDGMEPDDYCSYAERKEE